MQVAKSIVYYADIHERTRPVASFSCPPDPPVNVRKAILMHTLVLSNLNEHYVEVTYVDGSTKVYPPPLLSCSIE